MGDELVVRVELRVDRDMEYVHLKDQRGSGVEPVNVLSGYRFQDGLAYYESTRDTASHFFIDYLPKGTYVFEYSTRVVIAASTRRAWRRSNACTHRSSTATARALNCRSSNSLIHKVLHFVVCHVGPPSPRSGVQALAN